jgi:hypothetical protein
VAGPAAFFLAAALVLLDLRIVFAYTEVTQTAAKPQGQLFFGFGLSFPKQLRRIHKGFAASVAAPKFTEREILGNYRLQHQHSSGER